MAENTIDIAGASQDLKTIEDFVNLPVGSDVRPRLLPSVNVGTLAGTRDAIFEAGGLPATPFTTKALMTASALADGDYAMVTDDTVNSGLYVKTAGAWVKSKYSPARVTTNTELYSTADRIDGVYVNSDGKAIYIASGWTIAAIPVLGGQTYILQADAIENSTYIAVTYRTNTDKGAGTSNGLLPIDWGATNQRIFTPPDDAKMIFFSIKNQTDLDITSGLSVKLLDQTTANKVIAINGYQIASTNVNTYKSRLDNKKWCVIGDSITEHNFRTNKNYHDYVKDQVTNLTVYNYGISGTGYYGRFNVADDITQTDIDIISVAFGTNDWGISTKDLGAFLDTDTGATISACINICLQKLIAKFPTKKIVLFTPLPRADAFGSVKNIVNYTLEDLAQLIKKYADYYSLPCLDLLHQSNLHPWNATANDYYFKAVGYDADGLHPNDLGQQRMAEIMKPFLESF